MLYQIKTLLGISDTSRDDLLTVLIEQAIDEVKSYIMSDNIENLEATIVQMVVVKYNKIGTQGLSSENYSGVSFNYISDYPDDIVRVLKRNRRIKFA